MKHIIATHEVSNEYNPYFYQDLWQHKHFQKVSNNSVDYMMITDREWSPWLNYRSIVFRSYLTHQSIPSTNFANLCFYRFILTLYSTSYSI